MNVCIGFPHSPMTLLQMSFKEIGDTLIVEIHRDTQIACKQVVLMDEIPTGVFILFQSCEATY